MMRTRFVSDDAVRLQRRHRNHEGLARPRPRRYGHLHDPGWSLDGHRRTGANPGGTVTTMEPPAAAAVPATLSRRPRATAIMFAKTASSCQYAAGAGAAVAATAAAENPTVDESNSMN